MTASHLPSYGAGAKNRGHFRYGRKRNPVTSSGNEREISYFLRCIPGVLLEAAGHIIDFAAYENLRYRTAAKSYLYQVSHVSDIDSIICDFLPVDRHFQLR